MAKTLCGFCESDGKITNEHLFAEWIGEIFGAGRGKLKMQHELKRDDGTLDRAWQAYRLDQQIRMACNKCNSGWMNDLETAVQPIITPMILDQGRIGLDLRRQIAIATWAVKTAMVWEFLQEPRQRYFTQEERHALMRHHVSSRVPGAHVWLGRYGSKNDGVRGLAAGLIYGNRVVRGHISTFALGQFAVQVLVERLTAGQRGDLSTRPGPWGRLLIEIWPPPLVSAMQGVALICDEGGFDALFNRFLDLSAEGGPYRPNSQP